MSWLLKEFRILSPLSAYLWKSRHELRLSMVMNGAWLTSRWNLAVVVVHIFEITKVYRRPSVAFPEIVVAGKAVLSIHNDIDNIWKVACYSR